MYGNKALSVFLAAMLALSLCPAFAFGLEAGSASLSTAPSTLQVAASSGVAKATVSKAKVRALYAYILKCAYKGKGVFRTQYGHLGASDKKFWASSLAYAVYDIDGNGTPELLVRAGVFTFDMCWHVFTVSGKSAKYLGLAGMGHCLKSGKSRGLYIWNQRQGYRWVNSISIEYAKVSEYRVVLDSAESSGYPTARRHAKAKGMRKVATSPVTEFGLLYSKIA